MCVRDCTFQGFSREKNAHRERYIAIVNSTVEMCRIADAMGMFGGARLLLWHALLQFHGRFDACALSISIEFRIRQEHGRASHWNMVGAAEFFLFAFGIWSAVAAMGG